MNGRTPTKTEKVWLDAIVELGCIVCLMEFGKSSPASPHHTDGSRKAGAHRKTIPLCWRHHQEGKNTDEYVSIHPWKAEFQRRYGTQKELLRLTEKIILSGGELCQDEYEKI